jgi:hypothetical protein
MLIHRRDAESAEKYQEKGFLGVLGVSAVKKIWNADFS